MKNQPNNNRTVKYAQTIIQYRWWVILLTLGLAVLAASGGRFLQFSSDYRVFFSGDNPQLQAFEALQDIYTKNDNILIVLEPRDGKVFTRETLAVVEEVTRESWQAPYSQRVDSVTNFQHTWARGDDLVVEDLAENSASLDDSELERIKAVALKEPLLIHRLINPGADITAVNVTVHLPGKTLGETGEVVSFARDLADRFRAKYPDIQFYLTGIVFMNNAFNEAGQEDMRTLTPLMYLAAIVVMVLVLRSFAGTVGTVLVAAFAILTGMGLAGWAGIQLTPISANAPTIILTLGVADSIHLLSTMFHQMRLGQSRDESIVESLRVNHSPILITSFTTVIGFLSLNFSESPPFRDLGNIVSIGVAGAYIFSVTFLPAFMAVLPLRVKKSSSEETRSAMDDVADFVIRYRTRLFWGTLVLMALIVAQIPKMEINEKFNEYFDERYDFRKDNDYVVDRLTGFESIEYSIGSASSGSIAEPEYLAKLEEFAEWYRAQPDVIYVGVFTDVMKRLNKNMHGDDESYYRIPGSRELAAQYLLLYELSLPFGLDLNNQINIDKSSTRLTAVLGSISTRRALELENEANKWLEDNAPPSMRTQGSSPMIMFSHIAMNNIRSMMIGLFLALILISGSLVLALRSLRFGLVSLVPNLAPLFMTFGVWALWVGNMGLAISVVAPVALGIIVDDTVHFLSKYLRARRDLGKNPQDAVRYSFHSVGTALWKTSVILAVGFTVLSFSGFRMNSQMGHFTTLAIVIALAADFLFLPTLLLKIEGKEKTIEGALREEPDASVP